jgi:hypothetical protein
MSRYKGRPSARAIEKDFPHVVEMIVPLGGFGKKLDDMYEWHRAKGIQDHRGQGRRDENGCDYVTWCFGDRTIAEDFARKFDGSVIMGRKIWQLE